MTTQPRSGLSIILPQFSQLFGSMFLGPLIPLWLNAHSTKAEAQSTSSSCTSPVLFTDRMYSKTRLLLAGPNISAWPTSLNATSSQGVLPAAISLGFDGVGSRGFRAESINEATLTPNAFPTRSLNVSSVCHMISTAMANGRNNRSVTQRLCAQARRKNA